MRPAVFAALCAAFLTACDSNTEIDPVTVQWMDWPAEVAAGQEFRTRLVVWGVCALNPRFEPGVRADQSAVTFAPYFITENGNILCIGQSAGPLLVTAIDTAGTAPGLAADFPRTYEMRGAAGVYAGGATAVNDLPVRTFGEVVVRPSTADPARRNAAGFVSKEVDPTGCVRIRPAGLYRPDASLVLENQADTAGLSNAFVRGYIHAPAAAVCGESSVFHLVTRN